jgi:tetraacyldisaccharide 4'-kinase
VSATSPPAEPGKTPMTQTLCNLLLASGRRVAILSRGYGGKHERGCAVVSDGQKVRLTAAEAETKPTCSPARCPMFPSLSAKTAAKRECSPGTNSTRT